MAAMSNQNPVKANTYRYQKLFSVNVTCASSRDSSYQYLKYRVVRCLDFAQSKGTRAV